MLRFICGCFTGVVIVCVTLVAVACECALAVGALLKDGRKQFNKTVKPFFKRVRNMVLSRYELSFKQESLFRVGIKTDKDAFVKYSYIVGTVMPGSFDFRLDPIKYETTTVVEKIEVEHMSLPSRTMLGPIHMMYGDVLNVYYGKKVGYTL